MLSRQELERKSIAELKRLCAMYGVNPIGGTSRDREALIRALIAFPQAAIDQMRDGVGLHLPEPYEIWNILNTASGKIGSPTDSQMAMIRATLQFYHHPDRTQRYYQDRLFSLWLAKDYIDRAARLL